MALIGTNSQVNQNADQAAKLQGCELQANFYLHSDMEVFIIVTVLWIFSVCLHEFGHALVAFYGGDETVKDKGYLTMNPLRYTHPVLSILMPVVFMVMGGIGLPGGASLTGFWFQRSTTVPESLYLTNPCHFYSSARSAILPMSMWSPKAVWTTRSS